MKKLLIFLCGLAFFLVIIPSVYAETLREKALGCVTRSYHKEMDTATIKKDHLAIRYLFFDNKFCFSDLGKSPFTILEESDNLTKIRVYLNSDTNKAVEVWVDSTSIIP